MERDASNHVAIKASSIARLFEILIDLASLHDSTKKYGACSSLQKKKRKQEMKCTLHFLYPIL